MISATQIRKALKLFVFDPKKEGTEWNIQARDMSSIAHISRAKQLITFYLEGVQDHSALIQAGWHLACGIAKYEEVRTQVRETTRSITSGSDSQSS